MSRVYDAVEPSVINETLLKSCVEEQGPKGEAGVIAKKEGIDFKDVSELRLDFKNILKIDNLWQFTNLIKLQLDNNFIEKIDGLSSLVNLQWLDLSFNNIELVEGLDQLTKLRDLTLYNNKITTISNMNTLVDLQILSLGNNKLENLSDLVYLRRFEKLNTLTLGGNPFCKQDDYYKYAIAYLPKLVYLNYRLIDKVKREEAVEFYHDSIEELLHDEAIVKRKQAEKEEKEAQRIVHREAYVEDLDTSSLFNSMFDEDPEASKLSQLPGVEELLNAYRESFNKVCVNLFEFGLKDRLKRNEEIDAFFQALEDAVQQNLQQSLRPIEDFEKEKAKVFLELVNCTDPDNSEKRTAELSSSITSLWDILMGLEMQLVDQLEESIKDFERNMSDLVGTFVESIQEFISQLRNLETSQHETLSDIAVITLEKLMKNELEEEMNEDVRVLFVDKDTIINAVSASHDAHTFKIDNKEDDIVTRANTQVQTLIETIHAGEIKRNRTRVDEINTLLDHYRDEVENYENNLGA